MTNVDDDIKTDSDAPLLHRLRKAKPARHYNPFFSFQGKHFGQHISDAVTKVVGSWTFIIIQSCLLISWLVLNIVWLSGAWDPYPFILLNLVLSFQAAFTAPIIMMSQNRQSAVDRYKAENDYHINVKAELEIEELHKKIDNLKDTEIKELLDIIKGLEKVLLQGR